MPLQDVSQACGIVSASDVLYAGGGLPEKIYSDEVENGLAHCALEQAEVWAAAAAEDGNENLDKGFLESLKKLSTMGQTKRAGRGALATTTRVQPRLASAQAA